jgi:hypothetical protein
MMDNPQPTQASGSSKRPSAEGGQDDMRGTPGAPSLGKASSQRDAASEQAINERWASDLETDQTVQAIGDEAIDDGEVSADDFPEGISEDF